MYSLLVCFKDRSRYVCFCLCTLSKSRCLENTHSILGTIRVLQNMTFRSSFLLSFMWSVRNFKSWVNMNNCSILWIIAVCQFFLWFFNLLLYITLCYEIQETHNQTAAFIFSLALLPLTRLPQISLAPHCAPHCAPTVFLSVLAHPDFLCTLCDSLSSVTPGTLIDI